MTIAITLSILSIIDTLLNILLSILYECRMLTGFQTGSGQTGFSQKGNQLLTVCHSLLLSAHALPHFARCLYMLPYLSTCCRILPHFAYMLPWQYSYRCLWNTFLLREPLLCNTATTAETALQHRIWCFESLSSRGYSYPEECFLHRDRYGGQLPVSRCSIRVGWKQPTKQHIPTTKPTINKPYKQRSQQRVQDTINKAYNQRERHNRCSCNYVDWVAYIYIYIYIYIDAHYDTILYYIIINYIIL